MDVAKFGDIGILFKDLNKEYIPLIISMFGEGIIVVIMAGYTDVVSPVQDDSWQKLLI